MSLAGNLSDLSLPELLQVVALSRKTGALEICSEQGGVAWLGLRDGGIVRVALEDGDLDRESILLKAGLSGEVDSDVAAATLWDAAVQAILRIFDWSEGDFTFEPLDDPALQWRGPQGILLPSPLSPEFLALEGARLEDEGAAANDAAFDDDPPSGSFRTREREPEPVRMREPEPEFEREPEPEPEPDVDHEPEPIARPESMAAARAAIEPAVELAPEVEPPPPEPDPPTLGEARAGFVPDAPEEQDDTPRRYTRRDVVTDGEATVSVMQPLLIEPPPRAVARMPTVLICVDPDLPALERMKAGLAAESTRIHIFQSATDGLQRFKQYVVRGEVPAVVLGSAVQDPLDAHQGLGWRRFAGRLFGIAPRLRLVVLAKAGENVAAPGIAVVHRPEPRVATEADFARYFAELARALSTDA